MTRTMFSRRITLSLLTALMILSCSISGSPVSTVPPQPTETQAIETEPADTAIVLPTSTSEVKQEPTATSPGPSCTVLQDLNLRSGPGTAYRPPIRVLPANTV